MYPPPLISKKVNLVVLSRHIDFGLLDFFVVSELQMAAVTCKLVFLATLATQSVWTELPPQLFDAVP